MYYMSVVLILTELFHLEYLNLQSIISRSSDWISINRPPFDSSYWEDSNDICFISVALILTELFRFEFYNKNLILFDPISTLFRPYFDPRGSRSRPFRLWGFNFGFMYKWQGRCKVRSVKIWKYKMTSENKYCNYIVFFVIKVKIDPKQNSGLE